MESASTSSLNNKAKESDEARRIHVNDDCDTEKDAHHHTIGHGANQVASGAEIVALQALIADLTARVVELESLD